MNKFAKKYDRNSTRINSLLMMNGN